MPGAKRTTARPRKAQTPSAWAAATRNASKYISFTRRNACPVQPECFGSLGWLRAKPPTAGLLPVYRSYSPLLARHYQYKPSVLGRPCRRNQFLDRISNPILGSSTRASFAGRQQVASGFSQTRIAMMAETGEMVGASFLSICVTVGAASFGPPKARNLLSSALPFNVVARAPLFFWWVWRQLAAHPTSEPTPKPQTTWYSSETHPEPTSNPPYCMGEREEPTRSPPGTHREPSRNLHGRARGTTRSPREPTRNPPGTHPKPYLKQRRSPPPTHWCL